MSTTEIPAGLVKQLREETGAGMMDCKRALQETGGDVEAAGEVAHDRSAYSGSTAGHQCSLQLFRGQSSALRIIFSGWLKDIGMTRQLQTLRGRNF